MSQEFPEESLQDLPAVATVPRPRRRLNKNKIALVIGAIGLGLFLAVVIAAVVRTGSSYCNKVDRALVNAARANDAISGIGTRVDDLEYKVGELNGRADTNDGRVGQVEKIINGLAAKTNKAGAKAEAAEKLASLANQRETERVKAENQQYKRLLSYIRGANPTFTLCAKKDAEVEQLLNNGVWDIEGQIQTEYDRLVSGTARSAAQKANLAKIAADVAQVVADDAQKTADKAVVAGETALDGLGAIAEQKGRSVSKQTKAEVNDRLKAYWRQYDAVIKEGAPEE